MESNMTPDERLRWFMNEFWPINPISAADSSPNGAYTYAKIAVDSMAGKKLADGSSLTWDELFIRYKNFFNYMKPLQNGQYTKKENKLSTIEDYCFNKMYESNYATSQKGKNDDYLYGL